MTLNKALTERRGVVRVARRVGWRASALGLALVAGMCAAPTFGQAASRSAVNDSASASDRAPANAEQVKAIAVDRLSERLAQLEAETAQLRDAIGRIRAGENPREVLSGLRPDRPDDDGPDGMRARGQMDRRGPGGPAGPGPDGLDGPRDFGGKDFHGRGPGPMQGGPVTAEQVEQARAFIRAELPDVAASLDRLREKRPALAEGAEKDIARRLQGLGDLAQKDPVQFQIESMALRAELVLRASVMDYMGLRVNGADEASLAAARDRVAQAVAERTSVWLQEREQELAHMGERLTQARQELDAAKEDPSAIVARRVDELLNRLDRIPERDGDGPPMRRRGRGPADAAPVID